MKVLGGFGPLVSQKSDRPVSTISISSIGSSVFGEKPTGCSAYDVSQHSISVAHARWFLLEKRATKKRIYVYVSSLVPIKHAYRLPLGPYVLSGGPMVETDLLK